MLLVVAMVIRMACTRTMRKYVMYQLARRASVLRPMARMPSRILISFSRTMSRISRDAGYRKLNENRNAKICGVCGSGEQWASSTGTGAEAVESKAVRQQ